MNIRNLWKNLFNSKSEDEDAALHAAGATVRHANPFEELKVPRNSDELPKEFLDNWVVPFYMKALRKGQPLEILSFAEAAKQIDPSIVGGLLGDFDWRPRIVGAYFSGINAYREFEDTIGKHLLKSEVCYTGGRYCLALASFGGETAQKYLETYLDYYLTRNDLWFDQSDAMGALHCLNKNAFESYLDRWSLFVKDKPNLSLEKAVIHFSESMSALEEIRRVKQDL
ncbi:MAG: hypothetical protein EOP04_19865 [Proteobacteria bacterium]|nr:MAG: hypothetical protein EOP04_19865 [Pseudomonadota bacterium]